MNLDRRPVNEERACGAALGGSGCRSPSARDAPSAPAALPGPQRTNTSSIFSAERGLARLGLARLGLAWFGLARPPLLALSAALPQPSWAADVAQPPPRSHELCRLRPLTANICCGCLCERHGNNSGHSAPLRPRRRLLYINCSEIVAVRGRFEGNTSTPLPVPDPAFFIIVLKAVVKIVWHGNGFYCWSFLVLKSLLQWVKTTTKKTHKKLGL